jgi:hypothetical protein
MSPLMPPLKNRVFIDTETDGVRRRRRVWDVGIVTYDADGVRSQRSMMVADIDLSEAEPSSLTIGNFRTRHPMAGGQPEPGTETMTEAEVAKEVFQALHGAVVGGIVVNFDTEALDDMLRRNGLVMTNWHHLVCVEGNALGQMRGHAYHIPEIAQAHAELLRQANQGRWDTDAIAAAYGIRLPEGARHTAIGDAILAEMIHLATAVDNIPPVPGAVWTPSNSVAAGLDSVRRITQREFVQAPFAQAATA